MRVTRSTSGSVAAAVDVNSSQRTLSNGTGLKVKSKSNVSIKNETSSSSLLEKGQAVKKRKLAVETPATAGVSSTSSSFLSSSSSSIPSTSLVDEDHASDYTTLPFPSLPFSLEEAKEHLIGKDVRFEKLFDQIELKTYLELANGEVKELNIFRSLVTSILGQQISWLAARSIAYKFSRLFFNELPEKPDFALTPRESLPFPTPHACLKASEQDLRSAGLSGAKVKYVLDISQRFAQGRLDVRKLVKLGEEELIKELTEIKGVGVWTAQMLLMFSLRLPNIMPVGDLGVQRGMCIFFNSGREGPNITERKKRGATEEAESSSTFSVPSRDVPSRPEGGPSLSLIKSRLSGKKAKGNVYLTPSEMEQLSESWNPYRSVACLLMWPLVDQ